jgi:hypothetical protein
MVGVALLAVLGVAQQFISAEWALPVRALAEDADIILVAAPIAMPVPRR